MVRTVTAKNIFHLEIRWALRLVDSWKYLGVSFAPFEKYFACAAVVSNLVERLWKGNIT